MADPKPLLERKAEILQGVDMAAWGDLIDDATLDAALDAIGTECTAPPPGLIFEALRYCGPTSIHTVLVGQDPYPTPGDAQGLCFSVPGGTAIPESLKRVYGCLEFSGLRRERVTGDGKKLASGDLRPWAVQGVLMINSALTTRVGETRKHVSHWKPFVDEFMRRFCELKRETELNFLLWGGDARKYESLVRRSGHVVHAWSHPSPLADNKLPDEAKFKMCPHFRLVNESLTAAGRRPVIWDNLSPVVAFSDGSCPLNGKPGARASFAAVITGAQFGASIIRGEICPTEYELVDATVPELGVRETQQLAAPSNNRGELMGIIYCMLALLRGRALGHVEIVSDSQITVNTLLEWYPNRLKKGTEHELKNFDLVTIAWILLGSLREQAAEVVLTHTRSHRAPPPASAPSYDRFVWKGNDMADKNAELALGDDKARYGIEVLSAPAVLHQYARAAVVPPR